MSARVRPQSRVPFMTLSGGTGRQAVNGASRQPGPSSPPTGLSQAEASERRARGLGNAVAFAPSRSYLRILRDNALMSVNIIIFATGIVLVSLGLLVDALVTVGLVLLNILIAVLQEARSKRALDQIALLTRPRANVVRDGRETAIDPADVVVGDLLVIRPGDQAVADGRVVIEHGADVDESLLTGESESVPKRHGESISSGTFCVHGELMYEAEHVGKASLANTLTARARAFRQMKTPVQREVDLVLRIMVILILVLGGPIVLDLGIRFLAMATGPVGGTLPDTLETAYQDYTIEESVRSIAVIVGLVPQGLALMLTVTYALGAVRLAGKRILLQQANAIESLSHVDLLCLDKTGTLTTNRLAYQDARPFGISVHALRSLAGDFAASVSIRNLTIDALSVALPATARPLAAEIPFGSAWKWSAVTFAGPSPDSMVLGAPEVLLSDLPTTPDVATTLGEWTRAGFRVLLLARATRLNMQRNQSGQPLLPAALTPLGLLAFQEELQPHVCEMMGRFAQANVKLKVISGDHPETVAALARQAGIGGTGPVQAVSGLDLANMDDAAFQACALESSVFGRVTPEQKLRLIRIFQRMGHYVAMVGDGVNDVLALKAAQLGVAMEAGSQATRAVADLVLLDNSFGSLPDALREGQRIVRGTQDLIKLFVARSLSVAVVILGVGIIGESFPILPTHNALPAFLVVGFPTLALAAWAHSGPVPRQLLRTVLPFAVPAALSIGAVETTLYISYLRATDDVNLARTVLTALAVLCGLILILFVEPPNSAFAGGDRLSGDRRPVALAAVMLMLFGAVMMIPRTRVWFELSSLAMIDVAIVVAVAVAWGLGLRYIWRTHLLEQVLGLKDGTDDGVLE